MRRDTNGIIIYKGKRVDMYALMHWLIAYNNKNGTKYTLKTVTDFLVSKFLKSM